MTTNPHPSGLPDAYLSDRIGDARLVTAEGQFLHGVDLNDMQDLAERRVRRVGDMVARDGDRVAGCEIIVVADPSPATTVTVTLGAGTVYADGDARSVDAAILTAVPGSGEVRIGIKISSALVTYEADVSLVGPAPGTEAEGEPRAARVVEAAVWARETDSQDGVFFTVYVLRDGVPIDQTAPSSLTPVFSQIATYDFDANGHYAVTGCEVSALGKSGADQIFSIREGVANIRGWKRTREYALRHAEPETYDLETITAETHTYTAATGAANTVTVNRPPISSVTSVVVVKRITETVVRGATAGGLDALTKASVVAIESVVQGATTYTATTDYVLSSDKVSWAPAGAEPAGSSSYQVTYLYNEAQALDSVTDTTVVVSGGVNGRPVLVTYASKLPRVDLMCLDQSGSPVYVKGISARLGAVAPVAPAKLLKLAEVSNDWLATPVVTNNGPRNFTYETQGRYFQRLIDMLDLFDRERNRRDILEREPSAKRGIFTDNFVDDTFRDQGLSQTASSADGVLSLAIDPVLIQALNTTWKVLPWSEEIVVSQAQATSGLVINPYANFTAMPAGLKLEPPVDYWTEISTVWTSDATREVQALPDGPSGQSLTSTQIVDTNTSTARFIRTRSVAFTVEGFGVGEILSALTIDGVSVLPVGTLTADSAGIITGTFTIPANTIPSGTRRVVATGAAGSFASALYVGEGVIATTVVQRSTLVLRPAVNPVAFVSLFEGGGGQGNDPLAQSFALPEDRMIVGVNVKFTAIGVRSKGVRVQLAEMVNGFPGTTVLAEAFINMQSIVVGSLVQARFSAPVFCSADRQYCFVFLTDDDTHALAIARLGDVIDLGSGKQTRVSSQPYTTGVLFASANRLSWTAIQDSDLFFDVVAAHFTSTSLTVSLWSGAFTNISDIVVRASGEIPNADASIRYELVRADGSVIRFSDGQRVPFTAFVSETVTIRAVLSGSSKVSPILYPGALLIGGRIRTSGTYATRVFSMGTAIRVRAIFEALLPAGSGVTVEVDAADGAWTTVPNLSTDVLGAGWTEPTHQLTPHTAANGGRVRITMTGGPGARPYIARLRAYSI